MKTRRLQWAAFAALFAFAGCTAQPSSAELKTYLAIGPEYAAYVRNDPNLPPEGIQLRLDNVEAWRIRVGAPK